MSTRYKKIKKERFRETHSDRFFLRILVGLRTKKVIGMFVVVAIVNENLTLEQVYKPEETSQHCPDAVERH